MPSGSAQAFGIALAGVAGLAITLAGSWTVWMVPTAVPPASAVAAAPQPQPLATAVSIGASEAKPFNPVETRRLPPVQAHRPATVPLVDTRVPPPQPLAAEAWQVLAPELDQAWGRDTPLTVSLLEGYVAKYPDDPVATEKLYAALIAHGRDLVSTGQLDEGAAQLIRAEQVLPNRLEARLALDALRSSTAP